MKDITCVISQPTYIPWTGYFDLIDQADIFILLDTVQFEKRSWQQRNRIKARSGLQWLSIPVQSKGRFHQGIYETRIVDRNFIRKHINTLKHNYRKSQYFDSFLPVFSNYLSRASEDSMLSVINAYLIKSLCQHLHIKTPILHASEMALPGTRSELLINLCKEVGATKYLSTPGSYTYLMRDYSLFEKNDIQVSIHAYNHPSYKQIGEPFIPYASVIDLIFNEGEQASNIMRSGRIRNVPISEYGT